jgi:signal transduction histidine kinase
MTAFEQATYPPEGPAESGEPHGTISKACDEDAAARDPAPPPVAAQPADTPAQPADTPAQSAQRARAILEAQIGAVGASFLRLRPWIVAPPAVVAFALVGASSGRALPLGLVQIGLLGFFVYEAVSLARAGRSFVTPRRLAASLLITISGLSLVAALTGGWRSPLLPLLLAPVGVSFAAFGARRASLGVGAYLALHLAAIAASTAIDPWPALPMPGAGVIGLTSVAVAAALLWAGVAALSEAHRRAAIALDGMRRAVAEEAAMRVRDLESVGNKVAHEVRNPLSAVKAVMQLAARKPLDDRDRRRFEVALAEIARIEEILGDYLSFSRPLDDLRFTRTLLYALVERAVAGIEDRAKDAGVMLTHECDDAEVVVDPQRLGDALLNLADNALRACEHGGAIHLDASVDATSVYLRVRDGGHGMSRDDLARVGTPYFTTREGGTGLGVVLARTTARQHGGDLTFESELGAGTLATLTVPRYPGSDDGDDLGRG